MLGDALTDSEGLALKLLLILSDGLLDKLGDADILTEGLVLIDDD